MSNYPVAHSKCRSWINGGDRKLI